MLFRSVTAALALVDGLIKGLPLIWLGIFVLAVSSAMYLIAPLLIKLKADLYKGKNDRFSEPEKEHLQHKVEHVERERAKENLTVSNPVVGKSNQELEEKKQKREQLATALEQLRLRRDDIRRDGPERYDSLWKSKGREDSESRSWIDFATNTVRFTLGDVDAELFRNDANFRKVPGDSRHRDYDQMLLNLEQYEMRLRKLIGE